MAFKGSFQLKEFYGSMIPHCLASWWLSLKVQPLLMRMEQTSFKRKEALSRG